MGNILFIRTTQKGFSIPNVVPPLGLMYLAATLREKFGDKYNIKIIDIRAYGMCLKDIEKLIYNFKPGIIGCSVLSNEHNIMNDLADLSKRINKNVKFIVGGPHPTMYYEDVLKNNRNIDVAVIGEGENTICDLLRCFESHQTIDKVSGIAYGDDGKIVVTPKRNNIEDLDSIPFPAWDLIDIERYSKLAPMSMNGMIAARKYMGIVTSRGCPYQCTYCHNIFGKVYRKRSAGNVFKEILELYNNYKVEEFHVFDDIFNLDINRAKRICDLIISSGIKIKIAFPNAVRGDIMDEELLRKLKGAGTYSITFALETASPRLQKIIRKNMDIIKLNKIIEASDKMKLYTKCFFMLGFPTETIAEIYKTINFACKSRLTSASFFIVTPQRNTVLFNQIVKEYPGFRVNFRQHHFYISNKGYEEEIIKLPLAKLQRLAYFRFFLNPLRVFKIWKRTPRKILLGKLLFSVIIRMLIYK